MNVCEMPFVPNERQRFIMSQKDQRMQTPKHDREKAELCSDLLHTKPSSLHDLSAFQYRAFKHYD